MVPRKIIIESAMNGLVVKVGCTRVVFEKTDEFIGYLKKYFDNPEATEKEFTEKRRLWTDQEYRGAVLAEAPRHEEEEHA